jgi:hypothetical protein
MACRNFLAFRIEESSHLFDAVGIPLTWELTRTLSVSHLRVGSADDDSAIPFLELFSVESRIDFSYAEFESVGEFCFELVVLEELDDCDHWIVLVEVTSKI